MLLKSFISSFRKDSQPGETMHKNKILKEEEKGGKEEEEEAKEKILVEKGEEQEEKKNAISMF